METFEEFKAKVLAMPEEERWKEIVGISMVWDIDWELFSVVYSNQGLSDEEIAVKKTQYYDNCRNTLREAFGNSGIL